MGGIGWYDIKHLINVDDDDQEQAVVDAITEDEFVSNFADQMETNHQIGTDTVLVDPERAGAAFNVVYPATEETTPAPQEDGGLSTGAIVGICICAFIVILLLGMCIGKSMGKGEESDNENMMGEQLGNDKGVSSVELPTTVQKPVNTPGSVPEGNTTGGGDGEGEPFNRAQNL